MTPSRHLTFDRRSTLVAAVLFVSVGTAFLPALFGGFLDWDDTRNFVTNPSFRGLGASQLRWAATTFHLGVYQPLAWLLFAIEYVLWSLGPLGYHAVSLLIHAANVVLVFMLFLELLRRASPERCTNHPDAARAAAASAALFFGIHPLRAEVVAWASCQPYLPCAFFTLLATLAYLRAHGPDAGPRRRWYVASVLLYLAALMFKAAAISLPLAFLALDVYPLRRLRRASGWVTDPAVRRVWWEKLPFALIGLVFAIAAVAAKKSELALVPLDVTGVGPRLAQSLYGIAFYPFRSVFPVSLSHYYPIPRSIGFADWRFVLAAVVTAGAATAIVVRRRAWPALAAGAAAYLLVLLPNSGLVQIGPQLAADRYSYLSTIGLLAALAAGLLRWTILWPETTVWKRAVSIAALPALLLGILSARQSGVWRTPDTLWGHAYRLGGQDSTQILVNWGARLMNHGEIEEAARLFGRAAVLDPRSHPAQHNLAVALIRLGRPDEAMAPAKAAVALNPGARGGQANLGRLLLLRRELADAENHLAEAIRQDPEDAEVRMNLGLTLLFRDKPAEAARELREAVRLQPNFARAHQNLAAALFRLGHLDEAEVALLEALRLDPGSHEAHLQLELLLRAQGTEPRAPVELKTAAPLAPPR